MKTTIMKFNFPDSLNVQWSSQNVKFDSYKEISFLHAMRLN